jgi:uncharacterized protein DUF5681
MSKDRGYKVGYRRPPKNTQFKKGQSGNPNGRPKGQRSIYQEIEREFLRTVTIIMNGRKTQITAIAGLVRQEMSRAFKGDEEAREAISEFLTLLMRMRPQNENADGSPEQEIPTGDDDEIIERALSRLRSGGGNE